MVADTPPVTVPVNIGALQLYTVLPGTMPLVPLVGVITNGTPLQVTVDIEFISAAGSKVMVTVNGSPSPQVTTKGVTI